MAEVLFEEGEVIVGREFVRFGGKSIRLGEIKSIQTGTRRTDGHVAPVLWVFAGLIFLLWVPAPNLFMLPALIGVAAAAIYKTCRPRPLRHSLSISAGGLLNTHTYETTDGQQAERLRSAIEVAIERNAGVLPDREVGKASRTVEAESAILESDMPGTPSQTEDCAPKRGVNQAPSQLPCIDCGGLVEREAESCPHCGYVRGSRTNGPDPIEVPKLWWWGFGAGFASILGVGIWINPHLIGLAEPRHERGDEQTAVSGSSEVRALMNNSSRSRDVNSITVSKSQVGDAWPYVESVTGVIRCEPGTRQVTIELNGVKYGLNGKAQGQGGFEPSQSAAALDEFGIVKLPPSDWIKRGLALCDY